MPFCLHQWRHLERGDWWRLIWVCFLGVAVANAFLYEGIHRTTAMKASLETALEPVFLALMAVVFLHEGFSRRLLGALVFSLAGSFLLVAAGQPQEGGVVVALSSSQIWGDVLVIGAAFLNGFYSIGILPLIKRIGPMAATAYSCLLGGAMLLPFVLMEPGFPAVIQWNAKVLFSALYLSVLCTAVAYGVWNRLLMRISTSEMALTLNLQPVAGSLLGAWFLRERISGTGMLGALLILGAVWLGTRKKPAAPALASVEAQD